MVARLGLPLAVRRLVAAQAAHGRVPAEGSGDGRGDAGGARAGVGGVRGGEKAFIFIKINYAIWNVRCYLNKLPQYYPPDQVIDLLTINMNASIQNPDYY